MASPEELAASSTPAADAFVSHSRYGSLIIAVGGIFACVSSSNSHVMTSSRVPFQMARDGFLPKVLGKENENGIPQAGILFLMSCQLIAVLTSTLNLLVQMVVFVTSISWLITMVSVLVLRLRHPEIHPPFRMPCYPVTLIAAFLTILFMMTRFTPMAMTIGCIWIVFGICIYLAFTKTFLRRYCENINK